MLTLNSLKTPDPVVATMVSASMATFTACDVSSSSDVWSPQAVGSQEVDTEELGGEADDEYIQMEGDYHYSILLVLFLILSNAEGLYLMLYPITPLNGAPLRNSACTVNRGNRVTIIPYNGFIVSYCFGNTQVLGYSYAFTPTILSLGTRDF